MGNDRPIARPRIAIAHRPSARPGGGVVLAEPFGVIASATKQSRAFRRLADRDCFVASGSSQLAFRLRYLKAPRDIAVVKATAERAGWEPRPSPRPDRTGDTLTGCGIAYAQRSGAVVAIIAEAPEAVDIVLLNRPELPPAGTGESSIRPVAAAIANAVFDATAGRLRRAPLTPERLRAELA